MEADEIASADTSRWIAILPLGATEQHGPHLPPETDTLIAQAVCARVRAVMPSSLPITFLQAEPVGYSPEHIDFPVTQSLSYNEAIERWIKIGKNLHSQGICKLVMLNAHGGNSPLMTIVATELRVRYSMLAVATSWTRFGVPDGIISHEDKAIDIHGGLIETSVMLAAHPELVDMSKAADFPSAQTRFISDFAYLRAYGPHAFGWKMQDLNSDGVCGNASAAAAEIGEKLLDNAATGMVELLKDVDKHPGFKNGT